MQALNIKNDEILEEINSLKILDGLESQKLDNFNLILFIGRFSLG